MPLPVPITSPKDATLWEWLAMEDRLKAAVEAKQYAVDHPDAPHDEYWNKLHEWCTALVTPPKASSKRKS